MKIFILLVLLYSVDGHHRHGHLGDSEGDAVDILQYVPSTKQTTNDQPDQSIVTVQIPANVQQVVTQVSQHVPVVISQQLAKIRLASWPSLERVNTFVTQSQYHIGNNHVAAEEVATNEKCDFKCTQNDVPVCGYNGRCYREFESQCFLSKYNCLHTQKTFHTVDETFCQDTTTTKCYQGDM